MKTNKALIGTCLAALLAATGYAQESGEANEAEEAEQVLEEEASQGSEATSTVSAVDESEPATTAAASNPATTPATATSASTSASADAEIAKLEGEEGGELETINGAATPATTGSPAAGKAYDFISDGQRITLSDKDITIVPPKGWEVFTTHPSLTLLMQVPHEAGMKYQRTVQIASFSGSKFLDAVTAKEYEQIIVKKFTELSSSIVDYRMRNHMTIEMADGRDGILFYSEFQVDGVNLMQAHILVSSTKRHYVMTYTDLAEHFEDDDKSQHLTEAWEAMTSIELEGRSPKRFESILFIGLGAAVLVALGIVGYFVRRIRAGRKFAAYAQGHGIDENEPITREPRSFVSDIGETSGISALQSMPPAAVSDINSMAGKKAEKAKKSKGKTSKAPETDYNASNFDDEDVAV